MDSRNYPANFVHPSKLVGPKVVAVGRTTYGVPSRSRIHRTTRAGKPVVHVLTPDNAVHELHEAGEMALSPSKQQTLKGKLFSE